MDQSKEDSSFEAIQELWEAADSKDREVYLLRALGALRSDVCKKVDRLSIIMEEMKQTCECRVQSCDNKFITKKQAKIFVGICVFGFLCFMVGAGYLTWTEIVKITSMKVIAP